jgi:hypothetical protein
MPILERVLGPVGSTLIGLPTDHSIACQTLGGHNADTSGAAGG